MFDWEGVAGGDLPKDPKDCDCNDCRRLSWAEVGWIMGRPDPWWVDEPGGPEALAVCIANLEEQGVLDDVNSHPEVYLEIFKWALGALVGQQIALVALRSPLDLAWELGEVHEGTEPIFKYLSGLTDDFFPLIEMMAHVVGVAQVADFQQKQEELNNGG